MKKAKGILLAIIMLLLSPAMNAQRCAVLEFKTGVGISQNDVDGISAIFITYFRPNGYTMVERTQIDKVIDEQGFQRSKMTQSQMVRVGQILNVSKIVVGDINVVMGQYNVDVRVINVETGTISATEGATFATSSYRSSMQSVAQKLAAKIAITPGSTVQAQQTNTQPSTPQYVDLGLPSGTKWKSANESGSLYLFKDAVFRFSGHVPTREQWQELRGLCTWKWTGKGYKVTGDNGNSIYLPAAGCRQGSTSAVGTDGFYWTCEYKNCSSNSCILGYYFTFDNSSASIDYTGSDVGKYAMSVRLVSGGRH